MQIVIDISKDRYDEIMSMDWKNCRRFFDEEIRAIHDGKALEQEPCADMVSRDAMWDVLQRLYGTEGELVDELMSLPPVLPMPKMGKWVKTPKAVMGDGYMWYCDNCEYEVYQDSSRPYPSEKYCPNCGCKMHEVEE